jgi:hypothetical protein
LETAQQKNQLEAEKIDYPYQKRDFDALNEEIEYI